MSDAINHSDVQHVSEADLGRVMQQLIRQGEGLILLKGLNEQTRRLIEDAVWTACENAGTRRLAVLLRLESLVAVFESRRLRDLFLKEGLLILPHILHIAAYQRLNAAWGFNPQKVLNELSASVNRQPGIKEQPERSRRGVGTAGATLAA